MTKEEKETRVVQVRKLMQDIENEYELFSNIPINHPEYWDLRKELQRLTGRMG